MAVLRPAAAAPHFAARRHAGSATRSGMTRDGGVGGFSDETRSGSNDQNEPVAFTVG